MAYGESNGHVTMKDQTRDPDTLRDQCRGRRNLERAIDICDILLDRPTIRCRWILQLLLRQTKDSAVNI